VLIGSIDSSIDELNQY